jgi:Ca-activated chloride channel homolog
MPRTAEVTQERHAGLVSVDGKTYPLKSASLEARAECGIAITRLTQTYRNPYPEPLEVQYTLPLPADGAVTGYTVRLGHRVIRGEIRKREEAAREYRQALLEGRTASLLEQDRADTFTQRLGCLPPGQDAEIEIEVLQQLAFLPAAGSEPASWEYRFPTVVGIRYHGAAGRVPDAESLDPDRDPGSIPATLSATVLIADGGAGTAATKAPGLSLRVENTAEGTRATLTDAVKLDRDVVIRWPAAKPDVGVRVVEGKGLASDDGRYVLVTVTPPSSPDGALARDLTLLIDASGSMHGHPLETAKQVAEDLLRSLETNDRFEILIFSNSPTRLAGLTPARPAEVSAAIAQLKRVQASGGTEMLHALTEALKPLRPDSQRQIILLTDGDIGFESEVIGEVLNHASGQVRVHAVGIGSAPNRTLMRGVAQAGRGVEINIGLEDDPAVAVKRLLQATVRPVLTGIELRGGNIIATAPKPPLDVFEGQPALLLAEVHESCRTLEVRGSLAGSRETWRHEIPLPVSATPLPIGALFGRRKIEDLELSLSVDCNRAESLKGEIETAGLRHGITSSQTSLIAISEDQTVDPADPRRRERLAVEVPAGVCAEMAGVAPPAHLLMACVSPVASEERSWLADKAISSPYPSRARGLFTGLRRELARYMPPLTWDARILRFEGGLLIIDFVVQIGGLLLPQTAVVVRFEDGSELTAQVDPAMSTKPGPHKDGLTVRLALLLEDTGTPIRAIVWKARRIDRGKEVDAGEVVLGVH